MAAQQHLVDCRIADHADRLRERNRAAGHAIRDQVSGPYAGYANDILANGQQLLKLVNDVLDMSKIEAGQYELIEEPVSLPTLLRHCEGMVAEAAKDGGVRVVSDHVLDTVTLLVDRRAIRQVLFNLLSNAVKFTPPGGVVTVRGDLQKDGTFALLVADTGVGIEPGALAAMFEPFAQADASTTRHFGGPGLGLAINRRFMVLHGGDLRITSGTGEGAVAQAVFPAGRVVSGKTAKPAAT